MGLFGLVFLVVSLVLVGIGIVVGAIASALAALLLGLGVISSSVVVGLRSGRAVVGIRVFLLQCGILAGIPAGAICAWFIKSFFEAYGSNLLVLIYGGIGGAFAGIIVALLLDFISGRLHAWASSRLPQSLRGKEKGISLPPASATPHRP